MRSSPPFGTGSAARSTAPGTTTPSIETNASLGGGSTVGSAVHVSVRRAAGRKALHVVLSLAMPSGRARLPQPEGDQSLCLCSQLRVEEG